MTNHYEGTEHADLIPKSEYDWFTENAMYRYTTQKRSGIQAIEDASNAIFLRVDIHHIFDQKRLVIAPKQSTMICHVLAPGPFFNELTNLYHNVSLLPLIGISIEYLLARFAWSIFPEFSDFMQLGLTLTLCVYLGNWKIQIKNVSGKEGKELGKYKSQSKSRSGSSSKRQRDDTFSANEAEYYSKDREIFRERKRRRSFESEWAESHVSEETIVEA